MDQCRKKYEHRKKILGKRILNTNNTCKKIDYKRKIKIKYNLEFNSNSLSQSKVKMKSKSEQKDSTDW